ncbi:cilia- and flagella-associated protein 47-like [Venturia canescens]|uniref:cilia- and flagella-associated protein 47-like n=1 Tax=Venturia canescens TaxID=32260 RepID=UPI001C9D1585|nr:cilia- and flagella-associated protein 47-like [Venturia canescens]
MVFVRILRVHCREAEDLTKEEAKTNSSENDVSISSMGQRTSGEIVRLCIHGETELVQLQFIPDELNILNFEAYHTETRVLEIRNPSKHETVTFRFAANGAARCKPPEGVLRPQKSLQVSVTIGKQRLAWIQPRIKLGFDVIMKSHSFLSPKKCESVTVGTYFVCCHIRYKEKAKIAPLPSPVAFGTDEPSPFPEPKTPEKRNLRVYWANYLRTLVRTREQKAEAKRMKNAIEGWDEFEELLFSHCELFPKIVKNPIPVESNEMSDRKKAQMGEKYLNEARTLLPLTPLQIYNVKVSPAMFTFGMVVTKSLNFQELSIENKNVFPVMVKVMSRATRNIRFPNGNSVVLKAGSSVKILMEFRADQIGKFNSYINYIINENHSYELTIAADVVYKFLSIGARQIVLGDTEEFMSEECYRPLVGYVEVKNKLNAKTNFKWDVPTPMSYVINPIAGCVRGMRNLLVGITYEPDEVKIQSTEAIIVTEGGTYITLKLNTILPVRPAVAFLRDALNVGEVPLNVPYTTLGVIRNGEYNQVYFELDQSSQTHGLQAFPKKGFVPPRGIVPLRIILRFDVCMEFAIVIRVIIQHSHAIKLRVTGRVTFPMLKIQPAKIEMKRVSIDASRTNLVTMTNVGNTLLTLRFPLQDYPEFRIFLSDPSVGDQRTELEHEVGIIILPGNSRSLYLHFSPVDLASYEFYLPMIINEILGPIDVENENCLKPEEYISSGEERYAKTSNIVIDRAAGIDLPTLMIACTVAGHLVNLSKTEFNLDASVDQVQDTLRIINETNEATSLVVRIDELLKNNSPFTIDWDERGEKVDSTEGGASLVCTLKPRSETYLRVKFDPRDRQGDWSVEAPIFVEGHSEGEIFNSLKLRGKNPKCRIESNVREIYLCPVPLKNSTICARVDGPDRLIGEFRRELLSITFPQGSNVVADRSKKYLTSWQSESIQVRLAFRSSAPVSFRTKVEFFDAENEANFFVTVFATADNCLMSIHAYIISTGGSAGSNKFKLQRSSNLSIESEISDSFSMDQQASRGAQRRLLDGNATLSVHSNASQSSWNAAKILNNMKLKSAIAKEASGAEATLEEEEDDDDDDDDEDGEMEKNKQNHPAIDFIASAYERHMLRSLKVAEQWLYSGPLRYQFYPHVTEGITASFSNLFTTANMSEKRKSGRMNQSFIDILANVVGPELFDFIGAPPTVLPEDDAERIHIVLKTYENMLKFLIAKGACVCHVHARHLLNYSDYEMTLEHPKLMNTSKETCLEINLLHADRMELQNFEARSKQCWLDIILQTFKSFVLKGISADGLGRRISDNLELRNIERTKSESAFSFGDIMSEASVIKIEALARSKKTYSEPESLLLAWLEFHYEQQRQEKWLVHESTVLNPLEAKDETQERAITNFEQDLADGLVLITVTVAHCPFLVEHSFSNVYIRPRTSEEALHNAICLVSAWRKIRLGFMITPEEIIQPNAVQLLMLVTHLFETLPTYAPKAKIRFSCPLTEKITRPLNITNPSGSHVTYVLQFFANEAAFFKLLTERVVRLEPYRSANIQIEFYARKMQKTRAYLLLCGGAIGPTFSKNLCFVLVGGTSHLDIVEEYQIKSKLYQVLDKTLSVRVPYENAAEYVIWMTQEMPMKRATIKMERWSDLRLRKVPRRLFLNQKSMSVLEGAHKADLSVTVACIAPGIRNFWIIFTSKLGDFIIQITSSSRTSITDNLTVKWQRTSCICTDPSKNVVETCPLNISVRIPAKNTELWKCINHAFQKSLNPKEKSFWSRHLETNIGLRLIYYLMGDHTDATAKEFMHLFEPSATYKVSTIDKSSPLIIPGKLLTISDVKSASGEEIEMKIHMNKSMPRVYETTISLISLDKREHRLYNVHFLCENPTR